MTIIEQDLHQFSTHNSYIDLSFHQYLLLTDEPLLVHTGSIEQATQLIPQIKTVLNGKALKYIFVSHFESDECGGLSLILENFPEAKVICSEVTARQLMGFGIIKDALIKKPGHKLNTNGYELEFFSYPSEMHLWEGLLVMEKQSGIFFSSDLMMNFGEAKGKVVESNWESQVRGISHEQIPDPEKRREVQENLLKINPRFVATGHGPCLKL